MANGRENGCDRIVTGASGTETITVGGKTRFPCRFEREFDQCLAGSIGHGGDSQRPVVGGGTGFGDPYPTHRLGLACEVEGLCQCQALRGC
jgi:hypothetical protein